MNKLLLSNEAISIAVRDFLKFIIFLGVKLVLTNIILSSIYRALTPLFGNGAGAFRIGKSSVVLIKNWEKIQSFMH